MNFLARSHEIRFNKVKMWQLFVIRNRFILIDLARSSGLHLQLNEHLLKASFFLFVQLKISIELKIPSICLNKRYETLLNCKFPNELFQFHIDS